MRMMAKCDGRFQASTDFLEKNKGSIDFHTIEKILRYHPEGWTPFDDETPPICCHADHKDIRGTTNSQISEIGQRTIHWFTGSSIPCMSVFWPFTFDEPIIYPGFDKGEEKFSKESYWWRREAVNRSLTHRYVDVHKVIDETINSVQSKVLEIVNTGINQESIRKLIREHEDILQKILDEHPLQEDIDAEYMEFWNDQDRKAGI